MPTFEFRCPCGEELSTVRSMSDDTLTKGCECGLDAVRKWTSPALKVFKEHYSVAVGKMVSSDSQFRSDLKRASDEATARTGIPHDYQPVDLREVKVAPDEAQERKHRQIGLSERKRSYF